MKSLFISVLILICGALKGQDSEDIIYRNMILTGIESDELYTVVYFIDTTGAGYNAWIKYEFKNYTPADLFLDNGNYVDRILNTYYVGKLFDIRFAVEDFYFERYEASYSMTTISTFEIKDSVTDGFSVIPKTPITQKMQLSKCLLDENREILAATFYSEVGGYYNAESLPADLPFDFAPYEWNTDYLWASDESTDKYYYLTYYLTITERDNGEKSVDMHVTNIVAAD